MDNNEIHEKHSDNPSYRMIDYDIKKEIVEFNISDDGLLKRQLKDIEDMCMGVKTHSLDDNRKREMLLLMRDIYQYREIEHCVTASKFQVTKELFLIDKRIVDEIGLGVYSKTFSILKEHDLLINFTKEEINHLSNLRILESQLDFLWDKYIYLRNLYIDQQNVLNKELMKKKYDIININKLKNKISYNMVLMNKTESMMEEVKQGYRLTASLNKLNIIDKFIKPQCTISIGKFINQLDVMKINDFINLSKSNKNIKLGDGVIVIVYDYFCKNLEDITDKRVTKNVIHSFLTREDPKSNKDAFLEKHGCFVTGLVCDNTYGIARRSKIELLDMNTRRDFYKKMNNLIYNLVMSNKHYRYHTMESCMEIMNLYQERKEILDKELFNVYWKDFKGCIVNCSFGTHLDSYPNEWKDYKGDDIKYNIPYFIYYFYEFLQMLDKKKLVIHAAGNESLVYSGCGMYYEKCIVRHPIYKKYYIWAINIMLDGKTIHFSSNQPGDDKELYERSLCAPGTYIKSIHCFENSPELYTEMTQDVNITEYIDIGEEDTRFNPWFGDSNINKTKSINKVFGGSENNIQEDDTQENKNKRSHVIPENKKHPLDLLIDGGKQPVKFAIASGTSFSAPFISGIAAVLKSNFPQKDLSEIAEAMLLSATPILIDGEENRKNPVALEDITAEEFTNKYSPEIVRLSRATYGMGKVNIMNAFKYLSKRNS
jgi:hypothetical protein